MLPALAGRGLSADLSATAELKPRRNGSIPVNLQKAISIWLLIVFAESVNGTVRVFFVTPAIGDRSARRTKGSASA